MAEEEVRIRNYAVLDTNGLLIGYESKPETTALPGDIEVPDMDLALGKYRWDFDRETFQFVGRVQVKPDEPLAPMIASEAMAQGLRAIFAAHPEITVPTLTAQWFAWLDGQEHVQKMRGMRGKPDVS